MEYYGLKSFQSAMTFKGIVFKTLEMNYACGECTCNFYHVHVIFIITAKKLKNAYMLIYILASFRN